MEIKKINYLNKNFKKKFIKSLKETGFAIISNTKIKLEDVEKVQDDWRTFFNSKEKSSYKFNEKEQSGYFPFKSESAKNESTPDLKEFFHIYFKKNIPSEMNQSNTWNLRKDLYNLGLELLSHIEEDLGLDNELQKSVESSKNSLYRIIYYPALSGNESGVRAASHEDINLITILPAQSSSGLEAQDSQGKWHAVSYDPSDIVVNVGDIIQMFSQGEYKSTTHRVINPKDTQTDRISMPLFIHPDESFDLKEMTAGEYLNKRLKSLGLKF